MAKDTKFISSKIVYAVCIISNFALIQQPVQFLVIPFNIVFQAMHVFHIDSKYIIFIIIF